MEYRRPVWAEVSLEAVENNTKFFGDLVGQDVLLMAVVKADGYGHGAYEVAKASISAGANRLGVALVEEGTDLRQRGIEVPIQILTEIPPSAAELVVANDLTATVCSKGVADGLAEAASKLGKKAKVHVKVDTGMNRIGLFPEEALDYLTYLSKLPSIEVEGIFTHFALADRPESDFTKQQLEKFTKLIDFLEQHGFNIPIKHAANSAATMFFPASHFNMVRIGIALYGLYPSNTRTQDFKIFPALSLKGKVALVKRIGAGEGVSYGQTYQAAKPTYVATLPLGYADGYTRLLSNKSQVLIGGKRRKVAGTICMDQLMVEIGQELDVGVGDEVVLIGQQGKEEIRAEELADILGTINYEIVCMISKRVPRLYPAPKSDLGAGFIT